MRIFPCWISKCCPVSPQWFLSFSLFCSLLQRRLPLGCPRMDTSFKKWVSPGHRQDIWGQCMLQRVTCDMRSLLRRQSWRNSRLLIMMRGEVEGFFFILILPVMCVVQCIHSERWDFKIRAEAQMQEKNLPLSHSSALDKNNELCSGCYDNGSFITFKPRRFAQLVWAAQADRTERACIASPCLPQPIIPLLQHTDSLSRFTGGPPCCSPT